MKKTSGENLAKYVRRVMKEKGLTVRDVEKLASKRITSGYINSIMNGTAKNPSVTKLDALACGIGVSREVLFKVALNDISADSACSTGSQSDNAPHTLLIIRLMEKVAKDPKLKQALQLMVKLPDDELDAIIKRIRNKGKSKPDRKAE